MELKKLTVDALLKKLSESPYFINEFLDELTVNVTEMFRDPSFWRIMREEILPAIMLNHKQFKIWHAGCSSGEEVLSMSIMLKEMGVLQDVTVIATDLDVNILEKAKTGTYPIKNMELNEKNYIRFQGNRSFKDYYYEDNGNAVFNKDLLQVRSDSLSQRNDLFQSDVAKRSLEEIP
jgi:chemotaxis protein methyltransferase CheR